MDSDQPAHPRSLIRIHAVRLQTLLQVEKLIATSMDPDQTVQMRRLVWIHAGHKPIMLVLLWRGSFCFIWQRSQGWVVCLYGKCTNHGTIVDMQILKYFFWSRIIFKERKKNTILFQRPIFRENIWLKYIVKKNHFLRENTGLTVNCTIKLSELR
jgi:hypothetical protein